MDAAPEPFAGYDELPAKEIVERLRHLSAEEVAAVKTYEAAHQDRSTITGFGEPARAGKTKLRVPKGRPPLVEVAQAAAARDAEQENPDGVAAGSTDDTPGGDDA